jgi:hypothetical protein
VSAEQELNREIIGLIREKVLPDKGETGRQQAQSRFKQDWAPFRPNLAARNVAAKPADTLSTAAPV